MADAQKIVVLVPGITGSTLINKGDVGKPNIIPVWPTQIAANPGSAAKRLNDPNLVAGWPIRDTMKKNADNILVRAPVYSGLIDYFKQQKYTYQTSPNDVTRDGNQLVGFGYDWRQPNAVTAKTLNTWLTTIVSKVSSDAEIWLIGHSMGGLVSRYLLETGMSMRSRVTGLITLGTPHLGAPLALSAITGECDVTNLLNPDIIQQVVDMPTYPSGFELLPPSQITFVIDASTSAPASIYSGPVNTLLTNGPKDKPAGFGAPAGSFKDALSFFGALKYTTPPQGLPQYFLAYGSGIDTAIAFTYEPAGNLALTSQLAQNPIAANAAGDKIVPEFSALFTGGWVKKTYNAGKVAHGQLPNDAGVLDKIIYWMNNPNAPADVPAQETAEPALVG